MDDTKPPRRTGRERQAALRQRRADEGQTELRGFFMPTPLHAEAKQLLAAWLKKRLKNG